MKNLKLFLFATLAMFVAITGVNAADKPVYADGTYCTVSNANDLAEAISVKWTNKNGVEKTCESITINPGSNITLDKDLTFDGDGALEVNGGNVVLDLNGHTITFTADNYFDVLDGTVTIKNGTLVQNSKGDYAVVSVQDGAKVKTENLTINAIGAVGGAKAGKIPRAFDVNGIDEDFATLVVSADTKVNVTNGYGIVLSGSGHITMDGAWSTKKSVVAYADMNQITKKAVNNTVVKFNGGTYSNDEDITIPVKYGKWTLNNGTFTSKLANAVYVYSNKLAEKPAITNAIIGFEINNGTFETEAENTYPVGTAELIHFINGGTFKAKTTGYSFWKGHEAADKKVSNEYKNVTVVAANEYTVKVTKIVTSLTGIEYTVPVEFKAVEGQVVNLLNGANITGLDAELEDRNSMYAARYTLSNGTTGLTEFTMPSEDVTAELEIVLVDYRTPLGEDTVTEPEKDPEAGDPSENPTDNTTVDNTTTNETETPNTVDSIPTYLAAGAVSIIGIALLGFSIKKRMED